jgi:hypothetical protein
VRTGGGRFDPEEGFCYFVARNLSGAPAIAERHAHNLIAVNDLGGRESREEFAAFVARPEQRVLLDSGVFWLATRHAAHHGLTMDAALSLHPSELDGWDRLRRDYVQIAREHEADLWGYVELDQGGAERKRETRAWLQSEGLAPIPVYHPLVDGWAYLDELLEEGHDRVMVGNVVQARWDVRDRIILTVWERVRRHPAGRRPWLHLLGLGPYPTLVACPFNSVDTSNHIQSMRYGALVPGALALGPFSKLRDYLYNRASSDGDPDGYAAYGTLLGWLAACDERAWRAQQDDLDRLLGLGLYPDLAASEASELAPEAAA